MTVYMLRDIGKLLKGRVYDVPEKTAEKMIEKGWASADFKPENKMLQTSDVKRK